LQFNNSIFYLFGSYFFIFANDLYPEKFAIRSYRSIMHNQQKKK